MKTRFLHTSDFQIGMTRWFLQDTEDAQARFDAARIAAITRLGQIASEHQCDFIVVAGDVFEHNSISVKNRERALAALSSLPVDVYLLPGNHDPLTADSIFYQAQALSGVRVIEDDAPMLVRPGLELVGAPWRSKAPGYDLVGRALAELAPTENIRVMVGHGQMDNFSNDIKPDLIDRATVEAALRAGTIDYLALGDTHSAMCLSDTNAVWFSGAPEVTAFRELPTNMGENNSGKALVVDVTKTGAAQAHVQVEEVQIGTWRFEALSAVVESRADAEEFIRQVVAYPDKERTVLKYSLSGTVDVGTKQYLEAELAKMQPLFANIYPRVRTMNLRTVVDEQDISELELSGFMLSVVRELNAAEADDDAAADALNLLFQLHNEVK